MDMKLIDIVRALNNIADAYKHPMLGTDERIFKVQFDNTDDTTTFGNDEYGFIMQSVMQVARQFEYTDYGRINPAKVFYMCYLNEEGQVVWIYSDKLRVTFNTDVHSLGNNVWYEKELPCHSKLVNMRRVLMAHSVKGSVFLLWNEMDYFADVVEYMYKHVNTLDYNRLADLMTVHSSVRVRGRANDKTAYVDFKFSGVGQLDTMKHAITVQQHPDTVIHGHADSMAVREMYDDILEWTSNYKWSKEYKNKL